MLKETTKDEFYGEIIRERVNVHPHIVDDGSNFEFPGRTLFGRVVGAEGHYYDANKRYFRTV